jgi:hypothetical protein
MPIKLGNYEYCLMAQAGNLNLSQLRQICPEINEADALKILNCQGFPKIHGTMPEARCENCQAYVVQPIKPVLDKMVCRVSSELAQTD